MKRTFCILNTDSQTEAAILQMANETELFQWLSTENDFTESVNMVLKTSPDIIFLDLDNSMIQYSAFDLVKEVMIYLDYTPVFIGLSSSKKWAYDGIKNGFFDYLLKPLGEFDLRKSFSRINKLYVLNNPEKLCLKSSSDYQFIDINQILYLQADNNTTDFYLQNRDKVSAFKTLKFYERQLPKKFLRVHKSYIVNIDFLVRINFGKSRLALHGEKKPIPFSKTYKEELTFIKTAFQSTLQGTV